MLFHTMNACSEVIHLFFLQSLCFGPCIGLVAIHHNIAKQ